VLASLAAATLMPTSASANTVSVLDFGARGDGYTDDAAAFQAAINAVAGNGGIVFVPRPNVGYVIGDGQRTGTSFRCPSGVAWQGEGSRIIHRARTVEGRNELFDIRDVSDVTVDGFIIDGEEEVRKAVKLGGQTRRIALRNLEVVDCVNFAIACGDDGSAFEDVLLDRITIRGACGVAGTGSGINFFPRMQNGDLPASRGLTMRDLNIDVSDGRSPKGRKKRQAGPQCIKLNNLTGALIERCTGFGAAITGINVSNGTTDLTVVDSQLSGCTWGVRITSRSNDATTVTQNTILRRVSTRNSRKGALWLESGVSNTRIEECDFEREIVLTRSPQRRIRISESRGAGRATWKDANGRDVKIRGRRNDTIILNDKAGTMRLDSLTDERGRPVGVLGEFDFGSINGLTILGGAIGGIKTQGKVKPVLTGYRMEGTRIAPGGRVKLPPQR
jgi:hypothetical protein